MATYNPIGSTHNLNSPYRDPAYNESTGFITPAAHKKKTSNWIKFGIPVAIIVIIAAVVGAVLGIRASKNSSGSPQSKEAAASSAASAKNAVGLFATATNSEYMVPLYPATVSS